MKWEVNIDGKVYTYHSRAEMQDRMAHLDWWAINKVEVISITTED